MRSLAYSIFCSYARPTTLLLKQERSMHVLRGASSVSKSIDQSLASRCNSLTRTSELRVRQIIVAIYAWLSLRDTSSRRATNSEEFGVFNTLILCTSRHFTSETIVHHDRARLCHTACAGFLRTIRIIEGIEETMRSKSSVFNICEVKIKLLHN